MMTEGRMDEYDEDDERFDRLVDGELSHEEYRQLVSLLDDEPGGWRRCALAFLEAQALRNDFTSVPHESGEVPMASADRRTDWRRSHWKRGNWLGLSLVAAASFLLAFGLGMTQRGWWPTSEAIVPLDPQIVGHQQDHTAEFDRERSLAGMGRSDHTPHSHTPPSDNGLVTAGSPGSMVPANAVDVIWNQNARSEIPERLSEMFERLGHDVQRRIRYVPVELRDGREMVIPIEDVEIVPVSQESFQ